MVKVQSSKIIIYQMFCRLFGNKTTTNKPGGTLQENGSAKMNDVDEGVLRYIKYLGVTHIWLTGIIRHAQQTDYTAHGIPRQHPEVVKGQAGSPYAIADYYDVDPDLAVDIDRRMDEFEALVDRIHRAGMQVMIDFVPNHVAREYKSIRKPQGVRDLGEDDDSRLHFSTRNNFYYCWGEALDLSQIREERGAGSGERKAHSGERGSGSGERKAESGERSYREVPAKATGNDRFTAHPGRNDWYETVKLNYGIDYCDAGGRSEHYDPIPDTWNKMTDILLFWAAKGIDGFRCDMAEMVPTAFWAWATDKVKFRYPEKIFIGEVYDPGQYRRYLGAGFDYLYDKVGMYDCVRDVICGRRPAADITQQWQSVDDIRHHMLYFLENHDEQRIASSFFAGSAHRAIPGLLVSALLHTNPFMLYFGQEFGEPGMDQEGYSGLDGRTTIFDYWHLPSVHRGYFDRRRLRKDERALMLSYQQILLMANRERAVREGSMYDLMYVNPQLARRQYAFLRKAGRELLIIIANFADETASTALVIPRHAFEYMQFSPREAAATDLLSGSPQKLLLYPDTPIPLHVPANSGLVLKVKL